MRSAISSTFLLIAWYSAQSVLASVDGMGHPDEVAGRLVQVVEQWRHRSLVDVARNQAVSPGTGGIGAVQSSGPAQSRSAGGAAGGAVNGGSAGAGGGAGPVGGGGAAGAGAAAAGSGAAGAGGAGADAAGSGAAGAGAAGAGAAGAGARIDGGRA